MCVENLKRTLLELEGLFTIRNKVCLNSFIKFEVLVFIPLYKSPLSERYGDLLYKDRKFEFISKLFLHCTIQKFTNISNDPFCKCMQ